MEIWQHLTWEIDGVMGMLMQMSEHGGILEVSLFWAWETCGIFKGNGEILSLSQNRHLNEKTMEINV